MASTLSWNPNVGAGDRIFRTALGAALIALSRRQRNPWVGTTEKVVGGLSIMSAVTGYCFILGKLGLTTRRNEKNNLFHLAKQFLPGLHVPPSTTQQALPKNVAKRNMENRSTKELLSIH